MMSKSTHGKTEIIYFGTSDHAVILLNDIVKNKELRLKFVVTKPDKKVGRDQSVTENSVKRWCKQNGVDFITPDSLKAEASQIIQKIKSSRVKVGVVADYGLIIPRKIIESFEKGIINIHFSLLPKYRGASPVAYTILTGDKVTGITFLLTAEKMDTGGLLRQFEYKILEKETDQSLYEKLFELAGAKLSDVVSDYLNGRIYPEPQDEAYATYCTPSGRLDRTTYILKDDAKIDWTAKDEKIERTVRAFSPWPAAWTTVEELAKKYGKVLKSPSLATSKLRVKILEADLDQEGKLTIKKLQIEGKKPSEFKDFINGYCN